MTIERRIRRVCKNCDFITTHYKLLSTNNFGGSFASELGDDELSGPCICGSTDFRYCDVDNLIVLHPVDDLDFPTEVLSIFKQEGIRWVGDLISLTESELLALPNVAEAHLDEIRKLLARLDLALGADLDWPPPGFK